MRNSIKLLSLVLGGATLLGSVEMASAERRTNNLSKDVAVRHRRLLVKNRFEVAPLFESTINADFRHIIGGGAKLEYHFSDMISVGAIGVASTAINTKLVNRIMNTLEDNPMNPREPSKQELEAHLNEMPLHGAVYASLTPWYGKLAAFSQAYVAFDFYFQAGLAFAQLKSSCDTATICTDPDPGNPRPGPDDPTTPGPDQIPADNNPNNDPPLNDGQRLGLYLGFGIHVFLNDFLALDLTVRDYAFDDNPSGADYNANLAVTKDDSRFLHHLFVGVGLSIMFPTKVKRTP